MIHQRALMPLTLAATSLLLGAHPARAGVSEDCTVLTADVRPSRVPAGSFFRASYRWSAPRSLSTAYTVFVHFKNDKNAMVFQGDHMPSVGTGTPGWNGDISYERRVLFIGDARVVDNDGYHGMREGAGTIGLLAGKHRITVDFFEAWGGEGLVAHWSGPGIEKQEIPPGVLFRDAD